MGLLKFQKKENYLTIYISCEMVKEKMDKLNTSKEISNQILHMLLSHHGPVNLGWGSSIDPKTPEAITLHYCDDMDAKIKETFQKNKKNKIKFQ